MKFEEVLSNSLKILGGQDENGRPTETLRMASAASPLAEQFGTIEPEYHGMASAAADAFKSTATGMLRGFNRSLGREHAAAYYDYVQKSNPQWALGNNASLAGWLTYNGVSAITESAPSIAAMALVPASAPAWLSLLAGGAVSQARLYGDKYQEIMDATGGMASPFEATGMAWLNSTLQSTIEVGLGPQRWMSDAVRGATGRALKLGIEGGKGITRKELARYGSSLVRGIMPRVPKLLAGAFEEGTEELLQLGADDVTLRIMAGKPFSDASDYLQSFAAGAWGGAILGGATTIIDSLARDDASRKAELFRQKPTAEVEQKAAAAAVGVPPAHPEYAARLAAFKAEQDAAFDVMAQSLPDHLRPAATIIRNQAWHFAAMDSESGGGMTPIDYIRQLSVAFADTNELTPQEREAFDADVKKRSKQAYDDTIKAGGTSQQAQAASEAAYMGAIEEYFPGVARSVKAIDKVLELRSLKEHGDMLERSIVSQQDRVQDADIGGYRKNLGIMIQRLAGLTKEISGSATIPREVILDLLGTADLPISVIRSLVVNNGVSGVEHGGKVYSLRVNGDWSLSLIEESEAEAKAKEKRRAVGASMIAAIESYGKDPNAHATDVDVEVAAEKRRIRELADQRDLLEQIDAMDGKLTDEEISYNKMAKDRARAASERIKSQMAALKSKPEAKTPQEQAQRDQQIKSFEEMAAELDKRMAARPTARTARQERAAQLEQQMSEEDQAALNYGLDMQAQAAVSIDDMTKEELEAEAMTLGIRTEGRSESQLRGMLRRRARNNGGVLMSQKGKEKNSLYAAYLRGSNLMVLYGNAEIEDVVHEWFHHISTSGLLPDSVEATLKKFYSVDSKGRTLDEVRKEYISRGEAPPADAEILKGMRYNSISEERAVRDYLSHLRDTKPTDPEVLKAWEIMRATMTDMYERVTQEYFEDQAMESDDGTLESRRPAIVASETMFDDSPGAKAIRDYYRAFVDADPETVRRVTERAVTKARPIIDRFIGANAMRDVVFTRGFWINSETKNLSFNPSAIAWFDGMDNAIKAGDMFGAGWYQNGEVALDLEEGPDSAFTIFRTDKQEMSDEQLKSVFLGLNAIAPEVFFGGTVMPKNSAMKTDQSIIVGVKGSDQAWARNWIESNLENLNALSEKLQIPLTIYDSSATMEFRNNKEHYDYGRTLQQRQSAPADENGGAGDPVRLLSEALDQAIREEGLQVGQAEGLKSERPEGQKAKAGESKPLNRLAELLGNVADPVTGESIGKIMDNSDLAREIGRGAFQVIKNRKAFEIEDEAKDIEAAAARSLGAKPMPGAAPLASKRTVSPSSPATKEQDGAYLALAEKAKAGDKQAEAEAQRMVDEAAKKSGYTIGPVLHGTPSGDFVTFDNRKSPKGFSSDPSRFHFTDDERTAKVFAGDDGRILRVYLRIDDLDNYQTGQHTNPSGINGKLYGSMERKSNFTGERKARTDYRVESPSQIKSADAFTYRDDGTLIPLSERFNAESPSLLYSQREGRTPRQQAWSKLHAIFASTDGKQGHDKASAFVKDYVASKGRTIQSMSDATDEELAGAANAAAAKFGRVSASDEWVRNITGGRYASVAEFKAGNPQWASRELDRLEYEYQEARAGKNIKNMAAEASAASELQRGLHRLRPMRDNVAGGPGVLQNLYNSAKQGFNRLVSKTHGLPYMTRFLDDNNEAVMARPESFTSLVWNRIRDANNRIAAKLLPVEGEYASKVQDGTFHKNANELYTLKNGDRLTWNEMLVIYSMAQGNGNLTLEDMETRREIKDPETGETRVVKSLKPEFRGLAAWAYGNEAIQEENLDAGLIRAIDKANQIVSLIHSDATLMKQARAEIEWQNALGKTAFEASAAKYKARTGLEATPIKGLYTPLVRLSGDVHEADVMAIFEQMDGQGFNFESLDSLREFRRRLGGRGGQISLDYRGNFLRHIEALNNYLEKVDIVAETIAMFGANNGELEFALRERFGGDDEILNNFKKLVEIELKPNGRAIDPSQDPHRSTLNKIQTNVYSSVFPFNIFTLPTQLVSISNGLAEVGMSPGAAKSAAMSLSRLATHVLKNISRVRSGELSNVLEGLDMYEEAKKYSPALLRRFPIAEVSGMKNRQNFLSRHVPGWKKMIDEGNLFMEIGDMGAVLPTWKTVFDIEQARLAEEHPEWGIEILKQKAGDAAFDAVSRSQNPSTQSEKSLWQRGSAMERAIIPFSGQSFVLFQNLVNDTVIPVIQAIQDNHGAGVVTGVAKALLNKRAIVKNLGRFIIPAVLMGMVARRRPQENIEEIIKDLAVYPFTSIPVVGSMIWASMFMGWKDGGTPIAFYEELAGEAVGYVRKMAMPGEDGGFDIEDAKGAARTAGLALGVPQAFIRVLNTAVDRAASKDKNFDWQAVRESLGLKPKG